jgi:hypothetical protein
MVWLVLLQPMGDCSHQNIHRAVCRPKEQHRSAGQHMRFDDPRQRRCLAGAWGPEEEVRVTPEGKANRSTLFVVEFSAPAEHIGVRQALAGGDCPRGDNTQRSGAIERRATGLPQGKSADPGREPPEKSLSNEGGVGEDLCPGIDARAEVPRDCEADGEPLDLDNRAGQTDGTKDTLDQLARAQVRGGREQVEVVALMEPRRRPPDAR